MSNGSVPLPQGHDLQTESTQAMIAKGQAVQEVIKEAAGLGVRLHHHQKNKPPQVKAEIERGTTHKALWEKYSQEEQSARPVQRTLAVARTALKAGTSAEEVQIILQHDPQFAKIQQQQGGEKAQEYTKVMVRSAVRREQQVQNNQQQSRQQQKTRTATKKIGIEF